MNSVCAGTGDYPVPASMGHQNLAMDLPGSDRHFGPTFYGAHAADTLPASMIPQASNEGVGQFSQALLSERARRATSPWQRMTA
jgi:hypothetical protein